MRCTTAHRDVRCLLSPSFPPMLIDEKDTDLAGLFDNRIRAADLHSHLQYDLGEFRSLERQ